MSEQVALQSVTLAKHGLTLGMKPTTPKRYPAESTQAEHKQGQTMPRQVRCRTYPKSSSIEVECKRKKSSLPLIFALYRSLIYNTTFAHKVHHSNSMCVVELQLCRY